MEALLLENFREYIVAHYPELILRNQEEYPLSRFMRETMQSVLPTLKYMEDQCRPEHEVLQHCMNELIKGLGPSKTDYLLNILSIEYPREHHSLSASGTLTWNVVQLIKSCDDVFESYGFTENSKDSTLLRHAVIAIVHDYLISIGI